MARMQNDNIFILTSPQEDSIEEVVIDFLNEPAVIEYHNSTITLESDKVTEVIEAHLKKYEQVWRALS